MNAVNYEPIVSIIMPAYNSERYIEEAVTSVQRQTFCEWELLIIDDKSTDHTLEIAKRMAEADPRISVYQNSRNQGVAATRNRGFAMSKGRYIALLDSDDIWRQDKLRRQLDIAERSGAGIIYSSYSFIGDNGGAIGNAFLVPSKITLQQMLVTNYIGCSTAMIRGEIARKNPFSTDFFHEDYALWLSLLESGVRAVGDPEALVLYRIHAGSKAFNKVRAARNRLRIYRDQMRFSQLKSAWLLFHYMISGVIKYRGLKPQKP